MTDTSRPDTDRGCLAAVFAVPVALLTLVAGYFCWTALTIRPSGAWDDDASAGIVLSCVTTIGAAVTAGAVWALPPVRRVLGRWWALPALLLGTVAAVRWVTAG
ncbi:hypothetical protein [Streptomyces sp. NPDC048202]|uniref:hypothetical protein n=1 Tax=Streptomyces sp. NPDC048202 TaxID=3365514 RepID=UPI00371AA984